MNNRRYFLQAAAGSLAALGTGSALRTVCAEISNAATVYQLPEGTLQSARVEALPDTDSLLKRTYRPPNYETPLAFLNAGFTPARRFFVRYHLSSIPTVDRDTWRLHLGGPGAAKTVTLSLRDLQQRYKRVEIPALCYCAGNRRGFMQPHVPGIQWGHGAMGNALWAGVRLRDVLHDLDLTGQALEVTFQGSDSGVVERTPRFLKSLPLHKALHQDTLIALEMNGMPLPHWHGAPARLVVPGWVATYWVKHLTSVEVVTRPCNSFWMQTAYRIPLGRFGGDDRFPSQISATTTPVTELLVNALITAPADGHTLARDEMLAVQGLAWDGGEGIARVALSMDGGQSWRDAELGPDFGPYAWRAWHGRLRPKTGGLLTVLARATNRRGQTQGMEVMANPAGYHHNAIASLQVTVK